MKKITHTPFLPSSPLVGVCSVFSSAALKIFYFNCILFQATLGFGYQSQMLQVLVSNEKQLTIYVFFLRNYF